MGELGGEDSGDLCHWGEGDREHRELGDLLGERVRDRERDLVEDGDRGRDLAQLAAGPLT